MFLDDGIIGGKVEILLDDYSMIMVKGKELGILSKMSINVNLLRKKLILSKLLGHLKIKHILPFSTLLFGPPLGESITNENALEVKLD